jgi:hypothetical protein
MAAGESVSYVFSLMVTPVRPFDLRERFSERWYGLADNQETQMGCKNRCIDK